VLRSIDYSVAVAQERALKVSVDDQGRVAAALDQWRDQSATTFMTAYHEALAETQLWPDDAQACESMLRFFLLERALYETDYELNNHPERAHMPMAAVLKLVES
jgi:maltose alpha-D-glucosyltransferase / alpha-amylase